MSRLLSSTLRIGDMAPPFVLPDLYGGVVSLSANLERRPALLVFAPGSWSPGMRRQLGELDGQCERLRAAGVELLMVVSQDLPRLRRALGTRRPRFPVLADERRTVARDYGVYRALSMDGIAITCPSIFLVDRSGAIRFVYVGRGNEDLPDTDGLVRLAAWLVRAEEVEAEKSSYPTDGEIWLDEHTSTEQPEQNGVAADATAISPVLQIASDSEPPTPRRRTRRTKPPVAPTEA
jgi:peroxiredoxin